MMGSISSSSASSSKSSSSSSESESESDPDSSSESSFDPINFGIFLTERTRAGWERTDEVEEPMDALLGIGGVDCLACLSEDSTASSRSFSANGGIIFSLFRDSTRSVFESDLCSLTASRLGEFVEDVVDMGGEEAFLECGTDAVLSGLCVGGSWETNKFLSLWLIDEVRPRPGTPWE
ncbi:hypothetical protein OGAPHI_007454 [Ogataea philodendri]|uniref:Uncharacterized protein n=1 Tax=Ogataea philodendri TaxID=1378263 RepID=A0A9P8NVL2_9ASCO|nr:uncharacterized protein OGAPHI_007454 [Ogataea philodendri]KAH3660249.1 hypothetical protein OGAPHI_007454 [Ogataea philodendri]